MLRYYMCVTKTGYSESTHACSFLHFADVDTRCLCTRIPERCTRILVPRITTIQRAHLSRVERYIHHDICILQKNKIHPCMCI